MKNSFSVGKLWCIGLFMTLLAGLVGMTSSEKQDPRNKAWDIPIDPHRVVGYQSCEKCHANEIRVWKQTPHFETFATLHRKPEAQKIADRLGITSFKNDSNCIQCHYTMQSDKANPNKMDAVSGISCESCHGPAQDWMTIHNDYGGPNIQKEQETPEHRQKRLLTSIQKGMRNPVNVYMVAQSCYRCHTVPDEKLVNIGGHNPGSLDFEMVSWSQGMVRHNFLRHDNKTNAVESPERLRLMFVSGMIADLEFSMRATAKATEKATFGITSAKRTARSAERLKSAAAKLQQPLLDQILSVFSSVKLKLNNQVELEAAADQIRDLGLRFAASVDGSSLAGIDAFVPPQNKWK